MSQRAMGRPMSMVSGCTIAGTREGIATHSSMVDVMGNHVVGTTERGILLGEMSMDMASKNVVEGAKGIGIICMDHSMCDIQHNTIAGATVDGIVTLFDPLVSFRGVRSIEIRVNGVEQRIPGRYFTAEEKHVIDGARRPAAGAPSARNDG